MTRLGVLAFGAFATGAMALPASDVRGTKLACPRGTTEREAETDAHETWCQRADDNRATNPSEE